MNLIAEATTTTVLESFAPTDPELKDRFFRLHEGIHSREDPVTWRTLGGELSILLGIPEAEADWTLLPPEQFNPAKNLVQALTAGSYLEPLVPEILCSLGFNPEQVNSELQPQPIDAIIFSGNYQTETITFTLADTLKSQGKTVAVVRPTGHYNDRQDRVLVPARLNRSVDHLIIVASTQTMHSGYLETLTFNIATAMRNIPFISQVKTVDIVSPMVGGSRGHRPSQVEPRGFEGFEAKHYAKITGLITSDVILQLIDEHIKASGKPVHLPPIDPLQLLDTNLAQYLLDQLSQQGIHLPIPRVRFLSVDIHNQEYPKRTFAEQGFEFISASPAKEFADAIYHELASRELLHHPIKVFAPDEGAIPRTEELVVELLHHPQNHLHSIDIVYVEKVRKVAGQVENAWVEKVERWTLQPNGTISKKILPVPSPENPSPQPCVIIGTDDMDDTGRTKKRDIALVQAHFPNHIFTISCASHPVLSQGSENLNQINADLVLEGNTLITDELKEAVAAGKINAEVLIVDLAPTLVRALTA